MKKTGVILMALLVAVLFLLPETYAWRSMGQSAFNEVESDNDSGNVQLLKLEKPEEGETANVPIEGAVFLLFRQDGQQIGAQYVTDAQGSICVQLEPGSYYFEEIAPSLGYTYDTQDGMIVNCYEFTVKEKQEERVVITAYNIRKMGELTVSKTVEKDDGSGLTDAQKKQKYSFTVAFSYGEGYTYRIDGGNPEYLKNGETIELCHGQKAVFENIPVGVLYNVTETPDKDFVIGSSGHQGTITEQGAEAVFKNTLKEMERYGSLTVRKELVGDGVDEQQAFYFVAVFDGKEQNFTLYGKEGMNEKTFTDLPAGTEFEIREHDSLYSYHASVKEYSGTILADEELFLPFVNVYDPQPEGKMGDLWIKKEVISEVIDPEKDFEFEVTFEGEGAPASPQYFKLKGGDLQGSHILIENIPHGVKYTVRELKDEKDEYIEAFSAISGTITGIQTALVTFTNKLMTEEDKPTQLEITKHVVGKLPEDFESPKFEFTLVVDGKEKKFDLTAGESKTFEVARGAQYEVREKDYYQSGYSQTIVNGHGTADGSKIEIVSTNTFIGSEKVEISGEKTWELNGKSKDVLPDSVTVLLMNEDKIVEKKNVVPGKDGLWKYTFTAAAEDAEGNPITYTVKELPVAGFVPTYTGYDIKNRYVEPVSIDPPVVKKIIKGDNAPLESFRFALIGENDAPMPQEAEGNILIKSIKGGGTLEFGKITYRLPGTYVYRIHEMEDRAKGWTYDDAEYIITVQVMDGGNKLSAVTSIKEGEHYVSRVEFTNTYDKLAADETVKIEGTKTWVHGSNAKEDQPDSFVVCLYGDSKLLHQRQITAADSWKYSFSVPKYDKDGKEIQYSINELPVTNYKATISGYDLTNTYVEGSPKPTQKPGGLLPETGDWTPIETYVTVLGISMATAVILLIVFIILRRKSRKKDDEL